MAIDGLGEFARARDGILKDYEVSDQQLASLSRLIQGMQRGGIELVLFWKAHVR